MSDDDSESAVPLNNSSQMTGDQIFKLKELEAKNEGKRIEAQCIEAIQKLSPEQLRVWIRMRGGNYIDSQLFS